MVAVQGLRVGYARREITPALGTPLAGVPSRSPRASRAIRDPLFIRAIHFQDASGCSATLVSADLLIITQSLHFQAAARVGLRPDELLLSATHTHSGPGGYWNAGLVRTFMGPYSESAESALVEAVADVVRDARRDPKPASAEGGSVTTQSLALNRRRRFGPVDPELTVVRFNFAKESPVVVVSFGAHPVIGSERDFYVTTGDFPGELCSRLEAQGMRPLFFQGAVAGVSPLFPEFPIPLDAHLQLVGDLLEQSVDRAISKRRTLATDRLTAIRLLLPGNPIECRIFPDSMRGGPFAEASLLPFRMFMERMGRDGVAADPRIPVHVLTLGEVAWIGTPCDLGPGVSLAMKASLHGHGVALPMVGSQCDGYVGYVHPREEYEHVPDAGFRTMNFYENAMSLSGWGLGDAMTGALNSHLQQPNLATGS